MNLDELEKTAKRTKEQSKIKARTLYRLARELGFNSVEARFLSQTSEKKIRILAAERLKRDSYGAK